MPDRDPPIEPPDEFSEFAQELGDALESNSQKSDAAGSDEAETDGGSGDWSLDPESRPRAIPDGLKPYDAAGSGQSVSGIGGRGMADRLREQRFARGCLYIVLLVILLAIVTFVSCITVFDGDGGDGDVVGGGGSEVSPATPASADPSATVAATEPAINLLQLGEDAVDRILWELYVGTPIPVTDLLAIGDLLQDFLDSISGRQPTYTTPKIDIRKTAPLRLRFTYDGIDTGFGNTIFECGDVSGGRTVVCPEAVQPMPMDDEVEVWMFSMLLAEPVDQASPDRSFIYSIVFDSDGEAANDWQFFPPFDFDLFQGADRWYQLIWDHNAQEWFLDVTQVDGSQAPGPYASAVRAVIDDDTIVFFIPASEFELDQPPYRMTSFGHDGAYSESDRGADVSGVDPTEPLMVPSGEVYEAMPEMR